MNKILFTISISISWAAMADQESSPEKDIKRISSEIENIQRSLESGKEVSARLGIGPQTEEAMIAFDHATFYFAKEEWLSAIREMNRFLNYTQIPTPKQYLQAQFILARSYEELRSNPKSVRAYLRYLSAFVTTDEKDFVELRDVLQRVVALSASSSVKANQDFARFVSAFSSLELPNDVRPELLYLSARAATKLGETSLTTSWLTESSNLEISSPEEKARALYFQGLLEINRGRYSEAEEHLQQVIAMDANAARERRSLTQLTLARLAVKQKKPITALKYYQLVAKNEPQYRDALFESIFVHMSLRQYEDALSNAKSFLQDYPGGADAFQIKSAKAFLEINAGNLDAAKLQITDTTDNIELIRKNLEIKYSARASLNHNDLFDLYYLTDGYVRHPQSMLTALKIFGQIEELRSLLADMRGSGHNIVYTMGRAHADDLNPAWVQRAAQLKGMTDQLMEAGQQLSLVQRKLYERLLTPSQNHQLVSAEERRSRLSSKPAMLSREAFRWADRVNLSHLTNELADQHERILKNISTAAPLEIILQSNLKDQYASQDLRDIQSQKAKLEAMRSRLMKTLRLLREENIRHVVAQSSFHPQKKLFALYASNLGEEAQVLKKLEATDFTTLERMTFDEAITAWSKWEFAAKTCFSQYKSLEKSMQVSLAENIVELQNNDEKAAELENKLLDYEALLAQHLGSSLSTMVSHYQNELRERMIRQRKWSADIDFIMFEKTTARKDDSKKKHDLENQILSDQLSNIQQGVLW